MTNKLRKLCQQAAELLSTIPKSTRIRVVSHYDADGITAAAIICLTLKREGYDFHVSLMRNPFDKGFERISKEDNQLIIFTDMGSGQIETIEKLNSKSIIIDHHQLLSEKTKEKVLQINANQCDINGNYEACGATLAYSFALAVNENNKDLVQLAIAGATGDKQYIGGFKGYNKEIIKQGLENKYLQERTSLKLFGDNLFDSIYKSVEPFYSDLSGNKKGVENLFKKLNLDKDVKLKDLDENSLKKLQSILILKLIKKGCEQNILDTVIRKRYYSEMLYNCELERFADLLDSCGKGGNRGIGLSLCLGDKNSFEEAIKLEKNYRKSILDELVRLDSEGFKEKKAIRYFYSKDSSLGGVIGGIAMNFLLDKEKALISVVRNDDEIHVSSRGTQYLVKKGLDLGLAMKEAAKKFNGHGGGHKIAAGATIDINKEKDFLELIDSIINKQIKE